MKFDAKSEILKTERSVEFLDRDGRPASAKVVCRNLDAGIDDVWDAITNPDSIPGWFTPITGDLRLNGRFQLEGNAGGAITECEPRSRFALTWEFGGDISWVEVQLDRAQDGGTSLVLTHTAHLSEHWETYGPGATGVGWEMAFLGIAYYLEDPNFEKPDPEEFAFSEDGRTMLTLSSEAWGRAAMSAGTDADTAELAARNTAAFYTGQPIEDIQINL